MSDITLSAEDMALLREYLAEIEELNQREPEKIPAKEWDIIWQQIQTTGEIPAEYNDRVGVNQIEDKATGTTQPAYYDIVWEHWNAERIQIDEKYHDAIIKGLQIALSNEEKQAEQQALIDLLQQLIEGDTDAELPRVKYNKGTELKTSTDKLSNLFYSFAAPKGKQSGQREMLPIPREQMIRLKYESDRNNAAPITLFYDFFYNENQLKKLGIDGGFDSYDFFITAVFDNLFLEGNETVSLSKVWKELGNTGSPNTTQLTELYKRAVRGAATTINIDDSEVQAAWGNDPGDTYTEIISPVMPLQIKGEKFIANGNVAKAEIRILSVSPFFALSQSIGHFTTWKKEILQLYTGRKTKRYYTVLQYLMSQIAWMRNPRSKRNNKITYKELYDYCGDKSTRAKQLTRDMAYRLLDEVFIPTGYVLSYKEDNKREPGIEIRYSKNAAAELENSKKLPAKR